ncbi:MAG: hypothetical protein ACRDAM_22345 [Casimicrobium sp.]
MQTAAVVALSASTIAFAVERSPLELHEAMSDTERAEVIRAAVAAPTGRAANATEHKMLRMSPEQSRAELKALTEPSTANQSKSLRDRTIREVRNGESVTLVVGTALAKQSRLVRDANGQWVRTCSADHGNGAHPHTHAVSVKGSNRE